MAVVGFLWTCYRQERKTHTHSRTPTHQHTHAHSPAKDTREGDRQKNRMREREREREGEREEWIEKGTTRSHNNTRHGQHATGTQHGCLHSDVNTQTIFCGHILKHEQITL